MRLQLIALVGAALMSAADVTAATLVPYQASGWKYRQVPVDDPLAASFYLTSFDDSQWPVGQAAFGNFSEPAPELGGCLAGLLINTQWDPLSVILLRRTFVAAAGLPVNVFISIDNDVAVYVNGVHVFAAPHEGCPLPDDFSVVVPAALLSPSGSNLLAIYARDRSLFSFIDARVEGEFPPLSTQASTWGAVKAFYR